MSILIMIFVDVTACDVVDASISEKPAVFIFELEK
jgi:hypothetical protein